MFIPTLLLSAALAVASTTANVVSIDAVAQGIARPQTCYAQETELRRCYTAEGGNVPQNVAVEDIKFAAAYLRSYGRQTRAGRLLTMNAADTPDCGEWTLYVRGTALITAKHIDLATNTSVLFEDIATTMDGGANATPAQQADALVGCATVGGSMGVQVNTTHPTYSSAAYQALNAEPYGIIVKVVSSTAGGQSK